MDYKTLGIMTIFSNRKSEVVAKNISEAIGGYIDLAKKIYKE